MLVSLLLLFIGFCRSFRSFFKILGKWIYLLCEKLWHVWRYKYLYFWLFLVFSFRISSWYWQTYLYSFFRTNSKDIFQSTCFLLLQYFIVASKIGFWRQLLNLFEAIPKQLPFHFIELLALHQTNLIIDIFN